MVKSSLARSGQESTSNVRLERGQQLFEQRWNEIEHVAGDEWLVPSGNLLTGTYTVRLGDAPQCDCADATYRHVTCYHQVAAQIADSKSRTCDCCGARVLGRFLTEVEEDDGLLSWYPGEELCGTCISKGFWS